MLVGLLACLAGACGDFPEASGQATIGTSSLPIIGGTLSLSDPAVVGVLSPSAICTGTVVGRRTVLTAAHCFFGGTPTEVRFGDDLFANASSLAVVDAAILETFDSRTFANDIAMLALEADAPVPAVPLSRSNAASFVGKAARLIGFGDDERGSFGLKRHAQVMVSSLGADRLRAATGRTGNCFGDSGGPALFEEDGQEALGAIDNVGFNDCHVVGRAEMQRIDRDVDAFILPFIEAHGGGAVSSSPPVCTAPDVTPPRITCLGAVGECDGGLGVVEPATRSFDSCGPVSVACAPPVGSVFPLGDTVVACTGTDLSGNAASCRQVVSVRDTTAPDIELRPPIVLAADRGFRSITLSDCVAAVGDRCQGPLDLSRAQIVQVTSDEPEDDEGPFDGRTCGDIALVDERTVQVRAERDARGNGRVYGVSFTVPDAAGNVAFATCEVQVPSTKASAVRDGCDYCVGNCFDCATTSPACGTAPPGQTFRSLVPLARLGAPAPGGGRYEDRFEPYGLTNKDRALFAAGVPDAEETVLLAHGMPTLVARGGLAAPGGGTFSSAGALAGTRMAPNGDSVLVYTLDADAAPLGIDAGVYRADARGNVAAVMIPRVTPAPGGGVFAGAYERASIQRGNDVVFAGVISSDLGISPPYAVGIYATDWRGAIAAVVPPGAATPGGGSLDFAGMPAANAAGDIAFVGHLRGTPCGATTPQTAVLGCDGTLFLRNARGGLQRIIGPGDVAPGGGVLQAVYYPEISDRKTVLFVGDLTQPPARRVNLGLFMFRDGKLVPVARPGDELPGGGRVVSVAIMPGNWTINAREQIAFSARLDVDADGDGLPDSGVYTWEAGSARLVARSGDIVEDVGILRKFAPASFSNARPFSGAVLNDSGDVMFQASTRAGETYLLKTPRSPESRVTARLFRSWEW